MRYEFSQIDFSDESDAARSRRSGWLQAVQRGFHQGRPDEEFEKVWLDHVEADDVRAFGAWLPADEFGAGPIPVATLSSLDKTLNTGLEMQPLRMLTDVTASPAHRRRGLVRRLVEDNLADAAERGLPLAALTASEATIYGRWGFGAATFVGHLEVETGRRFGLRDFADTGRIELIQPTDSWPVIQDVLERFHAATRGSVERPQFYRPLLTGTAQFGEDTGPDKKLWGAVHLDGGGTVDGLVLYRFEDGGVGKHTIRVRELIPLASEAELALWQFLAGIDLADRVVWDQAATDDSLRWAVHDADGIRQTAVEDFLWVRVLDAPTALAARPWTADGRVVLHIDDAQGYAAGRFAVTSEDEMATVERTDEVAQLRLDAETLGSLYLGGAGVHSLYRAGRIVGDERAAAEFEAMADLRTAPHNLTGF